ncbi:c-type cytochrome [uncultured Roseovarius sp.]|uniref:c-type cytochrome n=1 Tax=uncultured Roseovarius sp. TaxID=293344 RepID=UPI0025D4B5EF|nr:c-type cytochrome [uncultured Roseovarius sp.]
MRALGAYFTVFFLAAVPAASQQFTTLKGHGGPVMGIAVNEDTGQVATASFDNSVGLWDARSPTWLEGHNAAVNTVTFAGPGKLVSAADDFSILVWDTKSGSKTRFEGHKGKVMGLAVSPDRQTLASASWDGTIGIWPLDGSEERFLEGHEGPVNSVVFGRNGLLYSASADGTLRIWDIASGSDQVLINQGFGINRVLVGPNDNWLVYGAVDGVTRVIDARTGEELYDFSLDRRPILSLARHAASEQLAVGDGHGFIMIIDTDSWRIVRDFRAMQQGPVWALAFSNDGQNVLAAGLSDVVYSWPVTMLDEFDPAGGEERSFLRDPDSMPNGERQFMRKCSICHALTPPPSRKAGPSLYGLFGRAAGTLPEYPYSQTLKNAEITWTDDTIDALFDIGPDHYIPGSKMPMQRITQDSDRQDLITFLRRATATKEN